MSEIRSRRLSRAPSALLPGVDAIAAPVFDYRDNLVAVVCVVARSDAKITGWDGSAVRALTDMAAQLSARLGFVDGHNRRKQADDEARTKVPTDTTFSVKKQRGKTA